jgi:hypothetical protein
VIGSKVGKSPKKKPTPVKAAKKAESNRGYWYVVSEVFRFVCAQVLYVEVFRFVCAQVLYY